LLIAAIRRLERWRLGLDVEFPEYDAYRRRPARIRASVITAIAAAGAVFAGVALADGVSHGRASTEPVTTPPRPGVAQSGVPSASHRSSTVTHATTSDRPSPARVLHTGGDETIAPSKGVGHLQPHGSGAEAVGGHAIRAAQQVDTRHASSIPSTAIAGAA
jgi:hypothetical protein